MTEEDEAFNEIERRSKAKQEAVRAATRQCSSCGGFCKKSGCERENVVDDDCYGYASRLAICIWEKHYKIESPNWKLSDTLIRVLTQIDNMTCGLVKEKTAQLKQEPQIAFNAEVVGYVAPQRTWVGLTDDEVTSILEITDDGESWQLLKRIEAKLKDKNA